jgi:hypothetical protein
MFLVVTGAELGGTVAAHVTMEDGTEHSLLDHLREQHQKGIRGCTEEYLASLHRTLHQRHHEPEPEHAHPGTGEPDEPGEPAEPAQA